MKRLFILILLIILIIPPAFAADVELITGDPEVMSTRQFYATGNGDINCTLSIPINGTECFELISIRLHLNLAGGANDFVITQGAGLGATYDTVIFTQDMTTVTDLYQTYDKGEAVFDNADTIKFAWTNGAGRTYGLEVLYRQK